MPPVTTVEIFPRGELLPYKGDYYLWKYVPSMAAAIIFTILFLACSAAHTWKMYHHRMWFCSVFVIGGYLEVIGYIGRAAASNATNELGPYIIQSVLLLVPPSLFAASIYMTLGRIIRGLGPAAHSCSIIRVSWLTKIFVWGDAFSFLIQSTGAGMTASGTSMAKMGEHVVVGGLVVQIIFFGLFVTAAVVFQLRFRRMDGPSTQMAWGRMMGMLYGVSGLILARCIFRVVEYVMGVDAYLLSNEWTLYVFDGLLMVAVMVIFYWWYPSEISRHKDSQDAYKPIRLGILGGWKERVNL